MDSSILNAILLPTIFAQLTASQALTPLIPASQPPVGASNPVKPSFPSFAIQGSSFPAYTGNASHPNIFSRNLIEGIQNRTGSPLVVRVGGTNTDFSNFNPSQIQPITPIQTGDGIGEKFVFGPSFYEGFKNWPSTRWIYDVPFAHLNQTDSLDEGRAAVENIGLDKLEALELGNEVDLYVNQGVRSSDWSPEIYASQFNNYSTWLVEALGLPNGPLFEVLTLSSAHPGGEWTAQDVFEAGITNGGRVKSVSFHQYEDTNTTTNIQDTLMSHGFMTAGVDKYSSDLQFMQENYPDIEIVFGESGRYTTNGSSLVNSEGIFGAALWTADYLLYLMTQNVTRVNMQLSIVFGYVAWHPVAFNNIDPAVRSPYFGHLFAADFMGGSSSFRIAEVETGDDQLAVYAGYDAGNLSRVAIINYDLWEGNGTRPTRSFAVTVPSGTMQGTVSVLTSDDGATALGGFYWAGQVFSYANCGVGTTAPEQPQPETVQAQGGKITVNVGSSQAVILQLE